MTEEEHKAKQKAYQAARKNSFVGTAEYMAPEVVNNERTRGCPADLWALGIIVFQVSAGYHPFRGGSDYLTFQETLKGNVQIPEHVDPAAKDLIEKLLVPDPSKRLGAIGFGNDFADLKAHPFFDGIKWDGLHARVVPDELLSVLGDLMKGKKAKQGEDEDEEEKMKQEAEQVQLSEELEKQFELVSAVQDEHNYLLT